MGFSNSQKNEIWKKYFPGRKSGADAFGRSVDIWTFEADHIYPESKGGTNKVENGIPLSPESNAEKADNLRGTINGKSYYVEDKYGDHEVGILHVNEEKISI